MLTVIEVMVALILAPFALLAVMVLLAVFSPPAEPNTPPVTPITPVPDIQLKRSSPTGQLELHPNNDRARNWLDARCGAATCAWFSEAHYVKHDELEAIVAEANRSGFSVDLGVDVAARSSHHGGLTAAIDRAVAAIQQKHR